MLARRSIKRLFYFDKYLLKANQIYNLSTNKVENNKLFLTDQYSSFTYGDLNSLSSKLSSQLLSSLNSNDLNGEKIAVLCSNNYTYLVSLLAIWKANGVPLGLNKTYPINLIEYFLNDSKCKLAINGISPEETKNSNEALDSLLSNQNVSNFKLVENEFFRNNETNLNDQNNALESLTRLLDLPENSSKEGLILYTSGK
jgi:acyl-CoA synthetase (AMP-forming)/AMP-acid ligase II